MKNVMNVDTSYLKPIRKELGFSLYQISDYILERTGFKISHASYARLEKGTQKPTPETWIYICKALELNPDTGKPLSESQRTGSYREDSNYIILDNGIQINKASLRTYLASYSEIKSYNSENLIFDIAGTFHRFGEKL